MNDLYLEILVKRKKPSSAVLIKIGLITAVVLFALGGLLMHPVFLPAAVVLGVASYFIISRQDKEFEYLYVNGDFDIDVIYNMQKRKRVGSYDVSALSVFAPENSRELDPYRNKKNLVVKDFTSMEPGAKVWCGVYATDKGEELVRLELEDDAAVKDMRRFAPRKVFFE